MSVKNVAEEYFSKLNPIATRLCADINETKAAYEELWVHFTQEERDEILNETIIKPEATLKYSSIKSKPKIPQKYAAKLIIEDSCSYPDEHSAPFSYRTPSQRDLNLFPKQEQVFKPQVPVRLKKETIMDTDNNCSLYKYSGSATNTLPKTGLDLLDNW